MSTTLTPAQISAALQLRDLTEPSAGEHAMQVLVTDVIERLSPLWGSTTRTLRPRPLVSIEDNYDRLGYSPHAISREARYTRYTSETTMLRSHTSAGIPPALRELAAEPDPPTDLLLALPGLVYRRDVVDRIHVGTPHQLDLWRVTRDRPTDRSELDNMIEALIAAVVPGFRWRTGPAEHPYTEHGRQIDVATEDGWVELAECGLAAPQVLGDAGLDTARWSGLALGVGLDRAVMLRKGIPDIRLLRAEDLRVAAQMRDLHPWHPVSMMPPVRRDLSIVADSEIDAELLGDRARDALGADADVLESLTIDSVTAHEQLPVAACDRLGTRPGQANVVVRVILRSLDRTLTQHQANVLRDRIYAALHSGPCMEWATAANTAPIGS